MWLGLHHFELQRLLAPPDAISRLQLPLAADPHERAQTAGEIANHLLIAGSFGDSRKLLRYLTLAGKSALEVFFDIGQKSICMR